MAWIIWQLIWAFFRTAANQLPSPRSILKAVDTVEVGCMFPMCHGCPVPLLTSCPIQSYVPASGKQAAACAEPELPTTLWLLRRLQVTDKSPAIVVSRKKIHNVTGAQVYLSCELKAVPTPVITWRKVSESRERVKLLEELPGDTANMAVQVRGQPSQHRGTGWVLGVYQCHTANIAGEAHADGSITVLEQNKSKKEASLLAWDNSA
ncbi:insulin-like growth factor-binding protein-like 1 [Spheniscus humboldti]